MSQNKKLQPLFGIHHAVWDEVLKYCKREGIESFQMEEFRLLVRIAARPMVLSFKCTCKKQIENFGLLFARRPDDVLKVLTFIRETLADQQSNASGKIRHFLLTRSLVRMKNGFLDNSKKGKLYPVSDLSAEDIARLLFPSLVFPSKTAKKFKDIVTRERKQLRRRLEPRVLWEDNDMIRYQKTGKMSSRLKSLLSSKGIK